MSYSSTSSCSPEWQASSYGLFPSDPAITHKVLSFTGPDAGFARTSKALNAMYKSAMSFMARELAKEVDRDLWDDARLLPVSTEMTDEQGVKLQQAALEKVRATWRILSSSEKKCFEGHSSQEMSSNPLLFHEILLAADEEDLVQLTKEVHKITRAQREKCFRRLAILPFFSPSVDELHRLPKSIQKLEMLAILNLTDKGIKRLPSSIVHLKNLYQLLLGGNQLTELPVLFGNLQNITELHLDRNQLTALPESFGQLVNLRELFLEVNKLTELPDSFGNLRSLSELYLYNNKLKKLPDTFGNLQALKTLFLFGNDIQELPESFGSQSSLTELNLANNNLKRLPASFKNLTSLRTLDLRGNPLKVDPELCRLLADFRGRGCTVLCDQILDGEIK